MRLDVYLSLKFVHMNVVFVYFFFRETFISDHVTLLSYYLYFYLVSMEINKITKIRLFLRLPSLISRRA
jgi:hypothetical protein